MAAFPPTQPATRNQIEWGRKRPQKASVESSSVGDRVFTTYDQTKVLQDPKKEFHSSEALGSSHIVQTELQLPEDCQDNLTMTAKITAIIGIICAALEAVAWTTPPALIRTAAQRVPSSSQVRMMGGTMRASQTWSEKMSSYFATGARTCKAPLPSACTSISELDAAVSAKVHDSERKENATLRAGLCLVSRPPAARLEKHHFVQMLHAVRKKRHAAGPSAAPATETTRRIKRNSQATHSKHVALSGQQTTVSSTEEDRPSVLFRLLVSSSALRGRYIRMRVGGGWPV
jgi:hypothetical protein